MSVEFADWMLGIQTRVEGALAQRLPSAESIPGRLHQAMRYASLGGGKRVRPLLAFAAGELTQGPAERLEIASCAVELIHAYSLVHDDLPCMTTMCCGAAAQPATSSTMNPPRSWLATVCNRSRSNC